MVMLIGLAGATRKGSFNAAFVRAAASLLPQAATMEIVSIAGIPVYDGDLEDRGLPPEVVALKDKLAAADGLFISTPEYNYSIPGALKNAIDWCSRPTRDIPR